MLQDVDTLDETSDEECLIDAGNLDHDVTLDYRIDDASSNESELGADILPLRKRLSRSKVKLLEWEPSQNSYRRPVSILNFSVINRFLLMYFFISF